MRYAYSFHSPFPCSDRDFYLEQIIKRDYPSPGQISLYVRSIPDAEEYPVSSSKVRATMIILGMVFTPRFDEKTLEAYTEVFMVNCCDINGLVPKWILNLSIR